MKRAILLLAVLLNGALLFSQTDSVIQYKRGTWGFGVELGPGTGKIFLTGDARQKLAEEWGFSNLGFTVSWKKLYCTTHLGGISSTLQESLAYGADWKKDNYFWSSHIQLSLGYELLHKKYFNIIPYVRGGSMAFSTRVDTSGAHGTSTPSVFSYAAGIAFDAKLPVPISKKKRGDDPWYDYADNYLYLRLYTGVYPNYFHPLNITGHLYYFNFSVGWYIRSAKRITPAHP